MENTFNPSDQDIVTLYLRNKIAKKPLRVEGVIIEVNVYGKNAPPPCDLFPNGAASIVYVFTRLDSGRGCWGVGNTTEFVLDEEGNTIGTKVTFKYEDRSGVSVDDRSEWIMDEYSLKGCDDYGICRIKRVDLQRPSRKRGRKSHKDVQTSVKNSRANPIIMD